MKAYKGFDKNMRCRGYQFAEGETYVHDGPLSLCESGFHACQDPVDCLRYYDPCTSVYHEVEIDGVSDEREGDTKVVGKKIRIGARIGIAEMVKASVDLTFAACRDAENADAASGDGSRQSASGDGSRQAASGGWSIQSARGNNSIQAASGDGSRQAASGRESSQVASGHASRQVASGDTSSQETTGKNCVMMSAGNSGKARGKIGSWIVLTEWVDGVPNVVAKRIDGKKIKEDTWYWVKNRKLVEAE